MADPVVVHNARVRLVPYVLLVTLVSAQVLVLPSVVHVAILKLLGRTIFVMAGSALEGSLRKHNGLVIIRRSRRPVKARPSLPIAAALRRPVDNIGLVDVSLLLEIRLDSVEELIR